MSAFVQIVEYTTDRFDEVMALGEELRAEMQANSKARRVTITADRDRPNTYLTIAEFASYDDAMENSTSPTTQRFAEQMSKLCDGPPSFRNLDVREEFMG
jgi:quinol monooxygenase YgiN